MRIPNLNNYLNSKAYEAQQALLLYGNNEGALQFHLDLIVQKFKQDGAIVETVSSLDDINFANELGLFDAPNQKTVTICRKVTGRDFPLLEKVLTSLDDSQKLILVGLNLGSKIKMVTFFQTAKTVGAVPSYDVSLPLLKDVILSALKQRDLTLPSEHIDILLETYSGSPLSLMTDMEKLELYLKTNGTIESQDLKQLMNGSVKLDVDQLIEGFVERSKEKVLRHGDVSLLEEEPYLILRSLIRQMITFCEFMSHRQFATSFAQAVSAMKTPLFFNTKPLFQRSESLWNLKLAAHGLRHLLRLEKRFKNGELSMLQFQSELCLFCR
ncbi:MAG TPA: hypothetical protein DD412_01890 [Holosporales bacterium]|nr:hypothetical protein [Holosporales bacterium]